MEKLNHCVEALATLSDQKRDQDTRIAPPISASKKEQGATYAQVVQIPASPEVKEVLKEVMGLQS